MADQPPGTLTITVYRIDPETGEKTIIRPRRVVKATDPLVHSGFPLCSCPKCVKERHTI